MARPQLLALVMALSGFVSAQDATVRGTVKVQHHSRNGSGSADVVVWLTRVGNRAAAPPGATVRLLQKNKQFTPHVLAVTVGTAIDFPNQDPFFHDVFSIYHGEPFDLGLYESGAVRKVRFSQPGVSYIFCNIHPQMSAVVVALTTPYFATTDGSGNFEMRHVPAGRYQLAMWYELAAESELSSQSREIEVTPGENALMAVTLHSSDAPRDHLNKYGEPYSLDKPSKY